MRGRIPTYYVGKRTHLPRTRVLIQQEELVPNKILKKQGKAQCGWITLGGYHIVCYGYSKKDVFKIVWEAVQNESRRFPVGYSHKKRSKSLFKKLFGFLHK